METGVRGRNGGRALSPVAAEHVYEDVAVIRRRRLTTAATVRGQTDRSTTATRTTVLVGWRCCLKGQGILIKRVVQGRNLTSRALQSSEVPVDRQEPMVAQR